MNTITDRNQDSKIANEPGEEAGAQSTETIAREMTEDERRMMGLSGIALFRAWAAEHGRADELKRPLDVLERTFIAPHEEAAPEEPPTERTIAKLAEREPPPARSQLAFRGDGALLLSIEDMNNRVLEGREIITFMVLNVEEATKARGYVEEALSDAAAHVIGRLPKLPS